MIETLALTKKYGKLTAVNAVSFTVEKGCCFALLGLNGAGKSTLIDMLTTLSVPTAGTAKVGGFDLLRERESIRNIVNISPQESAVAKNLTVRENLDLIASLYSVEDRRSRVEEIIRQFRLEEKADVLARKLSGGQKRRLSLALGIISRPQILFLDEPTLGLDVKARRILWDVIASLKGDMTVFLTTHYLEEAERLADKIGIISRGEIKAVGTLEEIKNAAGKDTLEEAFLTFAEEEA